MRHWPAHIVTTAEVTAGLPRGSIHATAFAADLLPLAVTGRISDDAWRAEVTNRLRAAYPEADVDGAVAAWSVSPGEINQPVLDLLRQRLVPMALVTNATMRLPQDLVALGLDTDFDYIINSSRIGVAKPDPGIFTAALQVLGVPADRALFVDDDVRHVRAAADLGIRSYQFQGDVAELAVVLRESGVVR